MSGRAEENLGQACDIAILVKGESAVPDTAVAEFVS